MEKVIETMSSDLAYIEIVGIEGPVLEFWSAAIPPAANCIATQQHTDRPGTDHPAYALMMLIGANNYRNTINERLPGGTLTEAWYEQHWSEYIESMELIATQYTYWRSHDELWDAMQARPSVHEHPRVVLDLAPSALYRLTVRDARDLKHLKPREVFGTGAYSPFVHPAWPWVPKFVTGRPGAIGPLAAAAAEVGKSSLHLFRFASDADEIKPVRLKGRYATLMNWQSSHKIRLTNRLVELFLRVSMFELIYFDPTTPGFNKKDFRYRKNAWEHDPRGCADVAGARGVFILGLRSEIVGGADGIPRMPLDYLHPDGVAWLDLAGQPRVRVAPGRDFAAEAMHRAGARLDKAMPSVDVEEYLAAAATRVRADIAQRGSAACP